MASWRATAAIAMILALLAASLHAAADPPRWRFGLRVHLSAARTAASRARMQAELDAANALFSPSGVEFVIAEEVIYPVEEGHVDSTTDLGWLLMRSDVSRGIDVFLLDDMKVLEDEDGCALGFASQPGLSPASVGHAGLVAVVESSERLVLGHELGHYFGLHHTPIGSDDPMTPIGGRGGFSQTQLAQIGSAAERYRLLAQPPTLP